MCIQMKFKKIIAALLAAAMITPIIVFAEDSEEYQTYEKLANFGASMYVDDKYTQEDIMRIGFSKLLEEHPEMFPELLKYTFEGFDEYSEFFTEEEIIEYENLLNRVSYGIGVVITKQDEYITITGFVDGGFAEKAGIKINDRIVQVNGEDAINLSTTAVKNMIQGELDVPVEISVLRDGVVSTFSVKRCEIKNMTVRGSVLKGNIGYIQMTNFATSSGDEFKNVLSEFDSEGITNVILDLRNNPGGYLDSAIKIAELVVPEGVIVSTAYRQEERNVILESNLKNPKYKFSVLVNENTASASEVLASAIQESGAGVLIGETTFGKGVIQNIYKLQGGSAIKLTTGRYLTRNGNEINGVGIEPDHEILNTEKLIDMDDFTKFDYKTKWKNGDEGDGVRAAEERLRQLGYNPGDIDGKFNIETENAIRKFQEDMGLYSYGIIDITTQVRLENETCILYVTVDKQFDEAFQLLGGVIEE